MSRKKVVGLVVLGVAIASAIGLALVPVTTTTTTGGTAVALVRLTGPIQETGGSALFGSGAITPPLVEDALERAGDDPNVAAVILRLDTPGGTVGASQEISSAIRRFEKPVVISMADTVASGGYYISAPADSIVANEGTLTGSIGVIWATIDPNRLLRKLGVKLDAITAGKHKDMFLPGHLTPERRRIVQDLVDEMYDQFVRDVATGRGLNESDVRDLATGELYTGTQALELGLVDQLGGIDVAELEAERLAGVGDAELVEYSPSVWDLFGSSGYSQISSWLTRDAMDPKIALLRDLLTGANVPRYMAP